MLSSQFAPRPSINFAAINQAIAHATTRPPRHMTEPRQYDDLSKLSPDEARQRKREWNRGPLTDLFPRIPSVALERILDIVIDKGFTYNLSLSKLYNSRRYTSIVVAHVRHMYSDYDQLLRDHVERFAARKQSGPKVWKVLREWCPWNADNEVLEPCFQATLLRPEERDPTWDPMDIDDDEVDIIEETTVQVDDPMDLD